MKKKLLLSVFGLLATFSAFAVRGDVNGDGYVTIADVTAIYDHLLNNAGSSTNCDVNGDGSVTISDVTLVYDILLNVAGPEVTDYTVNGVTFSMVKVEGGTFTMGGTLSDPDVYSDEFPLHEVTLSTFAMGQTEVTQALWQAVMGSNPSHVSGDNLPVETVSWDDCQEFIEWLNQLTGKTFRLPTEAEWEFAARGGILSKGYKYAGSSTLADVAWYSANCTQINAVGTKAPNELGLFDMSGNVYEWCSDWYGNYGALAQTNPTGPETGTERNCRGGSWNSDEWLQHVSFRNAFAASFKISNLGLRLAQ